MTASAIPAEAAVSARTGLPFDPTALVLALATLAVHLLGNPHYGFFRDELYFIVCGRHPDFGYVDQPPIVPLLAAGSQLFGVSLFAIRAVPALLAAACVYLVAVLAGDMGGGRFARILAALGSGLAPILAAFGTILGPDAVEVPLWTLGVLSLARALDRDPRWFLAAGAAFGVAGEAKYSAIIVAVALLIGVLATPRRRSLLSIWAGGGVALAGLILLPNALWQAIYGLPMLELLENGQHGKNIVLDPASFLVQQAMLTNPALAVIWLIGLVWCLARARWRWLGLGVVALLAIMIGLHGKAYYPAPIYPVLFASGAVALEGLTIRRRYARAAIIGLAAVSGVALLPVAMPMLGEAQFLAYQTWLAHFGFRVPETEHHKTAPLGQYYADMHGWQALADTVAETYRKLPPDERAKAAIITGNYGESAAIDVLAAGHGLPPALGGHNQYWLWGPRNWDGGVLLDYGGDLAADQKLCGSATIVGHFTAPYVMPYEDDEDIILCLDLKQPVATLWPTLKDYN